MPLLHHLVISALHDWYLILTLLRMSLINCVVLDLTIILGNAVFDTCIEVVLSLIPDLVWKYSFKTTSFPHRLILDFFEAVMTIELACLIHVLVELWALSCVTLWSAIHHDRRCSTLMELLHAYVRGVWSVDLAVHTWHVLILHLIPDPCRYGFLQRVVGHDYRLLHSTTLLSGASRVFGHEVVACQFALA